MKKPRNKGGRPRITEDMRKVIRVKERSTSSADKLLKNAKRLYFPPKKRDEKEGDYRVRKFLYFCERYARHVKGKFAFKPVVLMKWQLEIIQKLLGNLDRNGRRKFRRFFLHIARKNGKTFLICLLIIYFLSEESFSDPSSEIVSCCITRQQSITVLFNTCRRMVEISPELSNLIQVRRQPPILTNVLTASTFEPLASDAPAQLGKNLSLVIFDESHGLPNSELWDGMATSQSMREEPLFCSISTAGDSRSSFYFTVYQQMKEIMADPSIEPSTLVRIFEVPEELDWKDPKNFILANPALGSSREAGFRDQKEMIESLNKALAEEGQGWFKQFILNQFAKYGERTLVPLDKWDLCGKEPIDYSSLSNRIVYVGCDFSSTTDLTGLVLYFKPLTPDGVWDVLTWAWLAGENLNEVCRRDRLPYDKWLHGNIIFTGKSVIDISEIKEKLIELSSKYQIHFIGFDPHLADSLSTWGEATGWELIPVPQQTNFLSPPTKTLREKILKGKIRHGNDPLLRSMVESARVEEDTNGNIRLNKAKSRSRIDCLAAWVNAEYLSLKKVEPVGSVYDTRGIIFLGDPLVEPTKQFEKGGDEYLFRGNINGYTEVLKPKVGGRCERCGGLWQLQKDNSLWCSGCGSVFNN
jgi:phage terminase large subunit-like protein